MNPTFNGSLSSGVVYNRFCPRRIGKKLIDIGRDPSKQCDSNQTGILCGACMHARCIECPNNQNMTFFLVFGAAGIFLVFMILALNLNVTQGLINRLTFYANIVWAYKHILFPLETQGSIHFFKVFIAWFNLDFGIETCFLVGLNAFWKSWLQFLFPFYIWTIAGYHCCLSLLLIQ